MNVYAPCINSEKIQLWDIEQIKRCERGYAWCVFRDFNDIRWHKERKSMIYESNNSTEIE